MILFSWLVSYPFAIGSLTSLYCPALSDFWELIGPCLKCLSFLRNHRVEIKPCPVIGRICCDWCRNSAQEEGGVTHCERHFQVDGALVLCWILDQASLACYILSGLLQTPSGCLLLANFCQRMRCPSWRGRVMVPPLRTGECRRTFAEGPKHDSFQLHVNLAMQHGALQGRDKCLLGRLMFLP